MPIDPCGLAVDLARGQGFVTMGFYRDSSKRQRVAVYRVPRSRAWVPGLKSFMLGCCRDLAITDDIPVGGVGDDKNSWEGAFGWVPPFPKEGNHYCGRPDQWLEGSTAADPSLEWTPLLFSTCCEGVLPVGTQNRVAKFGPGGLSVVDSRGFDDGVAGIRWEGPMSVRDAFVVLASAAYTSGLRFTSIIDGTGGHGLLTQAPGDAAEQSAAFGIHTTGDEVEFSFGSVPSTPNVHLSIIGDRASWIAAEGWDVRAGLVFAVPGLSDLLTTLAGHGVPTGTVLPYAGGAAPTGYLLCDGAAVSRATYEDLFDLIGEDYGPGDGATTFNVPDLRGRTPIGAGSGPGLTARARGDTGGEETHTLTVAEMPSHVHGNPPTGEFLTKNAVNNLAAGADEGKDTYHETASAGGDDAHENMQPFGVVNYVIKT